jgi:hypothetical protein
VQRRATGDLKVRGDKQLRTRLSWRVPVRHFDQQNRHEIRDTEGRLWATVLFTDFETFGELFPTRFLSGGHEQHNLDHASGPLRPPGTPGRCQMDRSWTKLRVRYGRPRDVATRIETMHPSIWLIRANQKLGK